jgi:hydrogenase maturation protease
MKIIGCGNPDRGDDGAGVLVAQRLREEGLDAETHIGDSLALIEAWRSAGDVIVVDAVVTGALAGTVHVWGGRPPRVPASPPVSSHGLDIGKTIELAEALDRLPARLRVFGIEGQQFDHGSNISPEVECAIASVVRRIAAIRSERQAFDCAQHKLAGTNTLGAISEIPSWAGRSGPSFEGYSRTKI